MSTDPGLLALLSLQKHDAALDRLRHRHETLPERATLARAETIARALAAEIGTRAAERDELAKEEQRLDDEARSLGEKATAVDKKMYSGEISSPKELQAMQADIDQLLRHRQSVEADELELMERREPVEAQLAQLDVRRRELAAEVASAQRTLASSEHEIEAEAALERDARSAIVATVAPALLAEYEAVRARNSGAGAARLLGVTCQGCHLTIPSTEAERIKKAPAGTIEHCDNCGAILVP
jgi:predicted  nucleic acid-binding Zn-ribbon protein